MCPGTKTPMVVKYRDSKRVLEKLVGEKRVERGIWWAYPLLPVTRPGPTLGEAWTPLVPLPRLSTSIGLDLYAKLESQNPTGVYTDRGAAIDAWRAYEQHTRRILVSSLGDHAVSVATYAARLGIRVTAYMPSSVEYSKIYRIVAGGGRVELFQEYGEALKRGYETAQRHGYYFSSPVSPYVIEGYRTILLEAVAQGLRPAAVIVPMGSGVLAYSMLKAGLELEEIGFEPPRVIAVRVKERTREARILGLSEIAFPSQSQSSDKTPIQETLEKHGGAVIDVSTSEAIEGLRRLMSLEGLAPDIVASVTVAGVEKAVASGILERRPGEKALLVFTSGPIKDPIALSIVAGSYGGRLAQAPIAVLSETRLAIMRILAVRGSSYAYQIWRILQKEGYDISLKTVYHHLYVLEKKGLVESHFEPAKTGRGGRRRIYTLTPDGIEVLNRLKR